VFVRDGVVLPDGAVLERPWTAGERVDVGGVEAVAPLQASCVPLFSVPLATGALRGVGEGPDTALAFSPDGRWLAIGAASGEVLVVDGRDGTVRARRALAETLIREVAWGTDGALYAAEQSPDANVWALDPATLAPLASIRLADEVGSSPAPSGADPYAAYEMPAAYALRALPEGVLAVAVHGWTTPEGRRNASRVVRLAREGDRLVVAAAWPADGVADAVFGAVAVGGEVAVAVRRSADGPAPADLPVDGVQRLSWPSLSPIGAERFAPLAPWFSSVFVWDALALVPGGVVAGLGDGRVIARGGEVVAPIGAPIVAGDVAIAASVGFLRADGDEVFAVTSRTYVPSGTGTAPRPHPDEGAVFAWTLGDELVPRWTWRGPHEVQGLALSSDEVAVAAGPRTDGRTDLFGALVFARDGDGTPRAFCPTAGPASFRLALAEDGRVAVAEIPRVVGGVSRGEYRVTVLR
jgi:hypothetical protein